MKHLSTDIEAWGTSHGCDIRSIGGFLFDPLDPVRQVTDENTFYMACENPLRGSYSSDHYTPFDLDCIDGLNRQYDLRRDRKTVEWWYEQEAKHPELKQAFENPVDLKVALIAYRDFILSYSDDIRNGQAHDICVWNHGAAYDTPRLEMAFAACGVEVPWFYRAPRDTRTIFDDAGVEDHTAFLKKHNRGPLHHALWDSVSQASAIHAAHTKLFFERHTNAALIERLETILQDIADTNVIRDGIDQRERGQKALDLIAEHRLAAEVIDKFYGP